MALRGHHPLLLSAYARALAQKSDGSLDAFQEIRQVKFLIRRVDPIVRQSKAHEYGGRAKERLKSNTVLANSLDEVQEILKDATAEKGGGKFVMAHIKDDPACDARLKDFKATVRNLPMVDEYDGPGKCIITGETVDRRAVIAKSY